MSIMFLVFLFRHIDTAFLYFNEDQVGQAIHDKIAEGVIKRKDLFVTTKLGSMQSTQVKESLIGSLKRLQLDYIDLFLIHNPCALKSPPGGINCFEDYLVYAQKSKELPSGKFHIWISLISLLIVLRIYFNYLPQAFVKFFSRKV